MNKLHDHLVTMWKYFFTAMKFDQADRAKARAEGVTLPAPFGNLKNWFSYFGTTLLVIVIIIIILYVVITKIKVLWQI